ncbi:MAG: type II toxin-antitoxin system RelE/ParE family toxin [Chloroflexi bacterium]|nr:type II toxin-antitoxin system RelE/ParE family toxin [Chloroflexota bacterium]
MARVVWSAEALADLEAIRQRIARDAPAAAEAMVDRIATTAGRLSEFPMSGRELPEGHAGYREVIVRPYRVLYAVRGEDTYIVTVIHGARELTIEMLGEPQ